MKQYEDLDEMLQTEHARLVQQIAPYGKDIFIAKTFTTTMKDADAICATEKELGIRIAVGPSARFLPWFMAAKRVFDSGKIGAPFSMHVAHHHGTIDVFGPRDYYRDPKEGGPELSLGWYLVDLVMHFMAKPVTQVSALYGNFTSLDSPFMDCGKMTLALDGGAMAFCDMYFCNRFEFPRWEMEIVGGKGAVLIRQSKEETSVSVSTAAGVTEVPLPARAPHWELFWIEDFRAARAPALSAAHARTVTGVCLAARDSARQRRIVKP